jgi:ubiquinone/menaquinone biosynthesis C-methylase UbiE
VPSYLHYEDYPYPDPISYINQAPLSKFKTHNAPRKDNWDLWFDGAYERKSVLVVGCGTTEAIFIAAQEPMLSITGIDPSASSIEISEKLAKSEGIKDIKFINTPLELFESEQFDAIICSGVLHHIKDVDIFVSKLRSLCKTGSMVSVMVYGNQVRKHLIDFCHFLKTIGVEPDKKGIDFVRHLIESLNKGHPIRAFYETANKTDSQIADTWLHTYFKQYSASELIDAVERHNFKFSRWINKAPFTPSLFDKLPKKFSEFSERFISLKDKDQYDINQILNFSDAKITGAFKAI